jgi:hypothetical protein
MRSALLVGFGAWAFTWGTLIAKATDARPRAAGGTFAATVAGAERATPHGEATFGIAENGGERAFTITLGAHATDGAVVLTSLAGAAPRRGVYRIGEIGHPGAAFHAIYLAGSAERPAGAYRATGGTLEVFSATDRGVEGRFHFDAADEDGRVTVSGWFTAQH